MLSLKIIYKLDFQLIIAKIGYMGKDLNLRLIIRGSLDHAQVGPLENQPLMIRFIGGFFFSAKFGPGFEFFEGKQG
jgi:hypothetical protein